MLVKDIVTHRSQVYVQGEFPYLIIDLRANIFLRLIEDKQVALHDLATIIDDVFPVYQMLVSEDYNAKLLQKKYRHLLSPYETKSYVISNPEGYNKKAIGIEVECLRIQNILETVDDDILGMNMLEIDESEFHSILNLDGLADDFVYSSFYYTKEGCSIKDFLQYRLESIRFDAEHLNHWMNLTYKAALEAYGFTEEARRKVLGLIEQEKDKNLDEMLLNVTKVLGTEGEKRAYLDAIFYFLTYVIRGGKKEDWYPVYRRVYETPYYESVEA